MNSAERAKGNSLDRLPHGARVAIIRLRSMGDCILTTPAIQILKEARPDLEISVAVEDRFRAIFERNPAVSQILTPSYRALLTYHPTLCLNLHGGQQSMLLTAVSRAKFRAGFAHHRGAFVYNLPIPRAQQILGEERPVHTAEHLTSAMFYLGCPSCEIPRARLYPTPAPREPRRYAIFHPVATMQYKTWPAERFISVARHVRETRGLDSVFIGGAGDDLRPFQEFRLVTGKPLDEVMNLIAGASLFFGNDSGPAHIAAAFDIPLAVLYGREEHAITWAPWRASSASKLVDPRGITGIAVETAIAALDRL